MSSIIGIRLRSDRALIRDIRKQKNAESRNKEQRTASVTVSFLENFTFLQKYLTRYFTEHQDIEDVVQETYLRAYSAERHKVIDHPRAFLFRVARNLALTALKKKSRQITDYIEDFELPLAAGLADTVESEVEARQNIGIYCEAVTALPEQCRRVFLLRKVHGLSHREIAERMNLTNSSVEKHILNGALKCRAYIRERELGKTPDEASLAIQTVTLKRRQ